MRQIKNAIILAAGRGERLGKYSAEQVKPLTEINNVAIIDNLINSLIENNIDNIIIVTGYLADDFENYLSEKCGNETNLIFIRNDIYDKTNNIYSLWLADKYLHEDFLLFEADVFFERGIINMLIKEKSENVILIDKFNFQMNGTVVKLDSNDMVKSMFLKKEQGEEFDYSDAYKTVNFYKISKEFSDNYFCEKLQKHINEGNVNSYYELIIKEAIEQNIPFKGLKTGNKKWWEIDTPEDLKIAQSVFKD